MRTYPEIAVEKAMKRQEIILRAYAKKISWIEAAEILVTQVGRALRELSIKLIPAYSPQATRPQRA